MIYMLIIIKTKKQYFVEIGFFSAQEFRALYQIMQENILGAKMRQAIDHFLYTNVNTFLVLCYHLLMYIQFNFNHHVIGIKKFIILCSLWSVTRIYANLSKQRKKQLHYQEINFLALKELIGPFQLVCYFVLPFHQTL